GTRRLTIFSAVLRGLLTPSSTTRRWNSSARRRAFWISSSRCTSIRKGTSPFSTLRRKSLVGSFFGPDEDFPFAADALPSLADFSFFVFSASSCFFHSRSEEHTSELQSRGHLVCRLLLEKKKKNNSIH